MASSSNLLGAEQFSSVGAAPALLANEDNKDQTSENFLGYIPFSKPPRATKRSRGGSSGFAAAAALPGSIMGKLTSWFAGSSAGATSKPTTTHTAASSAGVGVGGSAVGTSPQPRNPLTSGVDDSHLSRKARRKKHRHERSEEKKKKAAERAEAERCYLESLRQDEGTGQPLGDAVRSIDDGLPIRDFIYSSAVGRLYYSTRDEICKPFGFYHGQRVIIKKGPLQGLRAIIIGVHGGQLHAIFEGETEASPFLRCYHARHLQEEFALEAISPPRSVKLASLPVPLDVPERVHNFLRFAPDLTLEITLNQNDGTAADEAARVAAAEARKRKKAEEEAAKKKKNKNLSLSPRKKQFYRKEGALSTDPKVRRRGGVDATGEEDSNDSDGPSELTNAAKLALRAASSASRLRRSVTMTPSNNNNKVSYAHHSMLRRSISFADAADLEIASPPNLVKSGTTQGPSSRAVRLTTVMEGGAGVDNNNNQHHHHDHHQRRRERQEGEGETPNGPEDAQNDWFLSRSFDAEQEGAGFYEGDADDYYVEEDDEDEDEDDDSTSSSSISESDDEDDEGEGHYNGSSSTPFSAVNPFIPYTEPRTPRPGVVVVYMTPTYALANGGSVGWSGEAIQPISGAGNIRRTQLFNFEAASFVRAKKEIAQTLEDLLLAPPSTGKVSPRSSMSMSYFTTGAAAGTAGVTASPLSPFSATASPAPAPAGTSAAMGAGGAAANNNSSADVVLREALTVLDVQKQMLSTATQPMIASISATVVVPLVLSRGAVDALASVVDAVEEAEAETEADGSNTIANTSFRTGAHGVAANNYGHTSNTDGGEAAINIPTVAPPEAVGDFLKKIVSAAEVFQAKAQEAVRDANKMFGLRSEFDMDAEFLAANQ